MHTFYLPTLQLRHNCEYNVDRLNPQMWIIKIFKVPLRQHSGRFVLERTFAP